MDLAFPLRELHCAQIAEEDRILETIAIPFHDLARDPEPPRVGDVIGDEVTTPSHDYLVITGTYCGISPSITAAKTRAWTSKTRR